MLKKNHDWADKGSEFGNSQKACIDAYWGNSVV
jgi:hypothetical protein